MHWEVIPYLLLGVAALPFIYYLLVLYSSWRFFRRPPVEPPGKSHFCPPVSILKPVRGMDPEAYANFASCCNQDYPEYEVVFCLGPTDEPALQVVEQLQRDFPHRSIRVLFRSESTAINDKVAKMGQLVSRARYEYLVFNDSDVRVEPDYLRTVVAPLARPNVGAVTCLYVSADDKTFVDTLQSLGMISDLYPGLLVARELDGVRFALGETIVTTKNRLEQFGGFQALENRPADDLLVGRLIAEQGCEVELLPYAVLTVPDYSSLRDLFLKRLRWMTVMRQMRPWGHLGLLLTQGLPWSILAMAIRPSPPVALGYLGTYFALRVAITWMIGIWGLKQSSLWRQLPLLPVWDAMAFSIWVGSFFRRNFRWRGAEYNLRDGKLVPASTPVPADSLYETSSAD